MLRRHLVAGPHFGVRLLNFGRYASKQAILEEAKLAENEGYYSVWVAERLVVPFPPNQPWSRESPVSYEVMTLLSYLAAVTERVKLGTLVLIAPFRNPVVLARQVTTLDVLSNGRVILGLGVGWMKEEFETSDVPMEERGARTDETIQFLREAWGKDESSFEGRFIKLGPSLFEPKPIQKQIPIWIGGDSLSAMRRVAKLGDGWLPNTIDTPEEIGEWVDHLRKALEAEERSIEDVTISCKLRFKDKSGESSTTRKIEQLQAVGVAHFIVEFDHDSASQYSERIKLFSRDVMRSF